MSQAESMASSAVKLLFWFNIVVVLLQFICMNYKYYAVLYFRFVLQSKSGLQSLSCSLLLGELPGDFFGFFIHTSIAKSG